MQTLMEDFGRAVSEYRERWIQRLCAATYKRRGWYNRADAEDAVQYHITRAWRHRAEYAGRGPLAYWIWCFIRWAMRSDRRKRRPPLRLALMLEINQEPAAPRIPISEERRDRERIRRIEAAQFEERIAGLTEPQKRVFRAYYVDGRSTGQIAADFGHNRTTIQQHLQHGHKRLHAALQRGEVCR